MRLHYLVNIKLTAFSFIGWLKAMVGLKIHPQASAFECATATSQPLFPAFLGCTFRPQLPTMRDVGLRIGHILLRRERPLVSWIGCRHWGAHSGH